MNQGTDTAVSFVSGSSRATTAVILLGITAVLGLTAVGSDLAEIKLLTRIMESGGFTAAEFVTYITRQWGIGVGQIALFLVTATAFLMWLHRVRRNLPALGAEGLRFTPGWAVGWWFVPIMNLFRPFQIMSETWRASDPGAVGGDWPSARRTPLIGWWWALLLVGGGFGNFANFVATVAFLDRPGVSDLLIAKSAGVAVSDGLILVATILAALIVRDINRRQEEKHRRLSSGAPPAG